MPKEVIKNAEKDAKKKDIKEGRVRRGQPA